MEESTKEFWIKLFSRKRLIGSLVISILLHFVSIFVILRIFDRPSSEATATQGEESEITQVHQQEDYVIPQDHETNQFQEAFKVHSVQRGESFWVIAKRYNISIDELMKINGLSSDYMLKVGDRLEIPVE